MKKKNKKILIFSIIATVSLVVVLLTILMLSFKTQQQTSYFYDRDIGFMKTTLKESKWFTFFEQAVRFTPETITLGSEVTLVDTYTIPTTGLCVGEIVIEIKPPVGNYIRINSFLCINPAGTLPCQLGTTQTNTVKYTPTTVGMWNARTTYYAARCNVLESNQNQPAIDISVNSVMVNEVITSCPDINYSNLIFFEDITNGKYEKRVKTSYGSAPDCEEILDDEFRTICNTNYHIAGTSNPSGSGKLTCEADVIIEDCVATPSVCSTNEICDTQTKLCKIAECNAPLITQCPDNFNITTKTCVNGIFQSTSENCSNHQLQNQTNQTSQTKQNQTVTQLSCWRILNNMCSNYNVTTSSCPTNTYASNTLCKNSLSTQNDSFNTWVLIIVGVVFILVIIIFILIKFVFKRK